jgi:CHAT domain-containing protein/Tfp pilus assembly protein PilF
MGNPLARLPRPLLVLACVGLLAGMGCVSPPAAEEEKGYLHLGEVTETRIELAEESFVRLRLATHNVMAHLEVVAEDGSVLAESRSGNDLVNERVVAFLAPPGVHTVRLGGYAGANPGTYALLRAETRPPEPGDADRIRAWDLVQRAFEFPAHPELTKPEQVEAAMRHADETFGRLGVPIGQAASWRILGDLYRYQERYTEALEAYERGLERYGSPGGDLRLRAELLTGRLFNLIELKKSDAFAQSYPEVLGAWEAARDPARRLEVQHALATQLYYDDHLHEARDLYEDILRQQRESGDVVGQITTLSSLGPAYRRLGMMAEARRTYREAPELARSAGYEELKAQGFLNLGVFHRAVGEPQEALRYLRQAAEILDPEATSSRLSLLLNLGQSHYQLGRPVEALEYYDQGLALAEGVGETDRRQMQSKLHRASGTAHLALGDIDAAVRSYDAALEMLEPLRDNPAYGRDLAVARLRRARALQDQGDVEQMPEIQAAAEILAGQDGVDERIFGRLELAEAQRRVRDWKGSRASWDHALKISRQALQQPYERAALLGLARTLRDQGNRRAALKTAGEAITLGEDMGHQVHSARLRTSFLSRTQDAYDLQIELLYQEYLETGDSAMARRAWEIHEHRSARVLREQLLRAENGLETWPPELRRQREGLTDRLEGARLELARLEEGDEKASRALRAEIAELEDDFHALEWRLTGEERSGLPSTPVALEDIQGKLGRGAGLLTYALGEERSFVFLVTADRIFLRPLDLSPADLESRVAGLVAALRSTWNHGKNRRDSSGGWLYRRLLGPLDGELRGLDRLVVIPDRSLWRLPFDALLDGETVALERWSFTVAPSATVWSHLEDKVSGCRKGRLVAFADPDWAGKGNSSSPWPLLPYTREEARRIDAEPVYVGADASESRLKASRLVASACRLHLATHAGVSEGARSTFSGLLLTPGHGEDGDLQVFEIAALKLQADLVVLSACNTARGESYRGEGVLGLSQAFFTAGVRGLVVSLWPVQDEVSTVTLMERFYEHLEQGEGPAQALRSAKLGAVGSDVHAVSAFVFLGAG